MTNFTTPSGIFNLNIEVKKDDLEKLNGLNLLKPYYLNGEGPIAIDPYENGDDGFSTIGEMAVTWVVLELVSAPLDLIVTHLKLEGLECDITLHHKVVAKDGVEQLEPANENIYIRKKDDTLVAYVNSKNNLHIALTAMDSWNELHGKGITAADQHFANIVKTFHPYGFMYQWGNL